MFSDGAVQWAPITTMKARIDNNMTVSPYYGWSYQYIDYGNGTYMLRWFTPTGAGGDDGGGQKSALSGIMW